MKCLTVLDIPKEWLHAVIISIYQKGQKSLASNCRPISLTSTICKVKKAIMKDKITTHLECNGLLSPHQNGSRSGRLVRSDFWKLRITAQRQLKMDSLWISYTRLL